MSAALLGTVLGLAYISAAAAQQCEPSKAAERYPAYAGKTVRVAVTPNVPPFTYADPKDRSRIIGVEAEIIERVLDCAGLKFEYVLGNWNGHLAGLFLGATDVMVGNVNYTGDRAQKADFVVFMRNGTGVVVRRGNPRGIRTVSDLCGTTSSMGMASSSRTETERLSRQCVSEGRPPIGIQPSDGTEPAYRLLSNERVDSVTDAAASAAARVADSPGEFELAFVRVTDNLSGPVVAKGNGAMARIILDGLKVMEQSGDLRRLMAKYGLPDQLLLPAEVRN